MSNPALRSILRSRFQEHGEEQDRGPPKKRRKVTFALPDDVQFPIDVFSIIAEYSDISVWLAMRLVSKRLKNFFENVCVYPYHNPSHFYAYCCDSMFSSTTDSPRTCMCIRLFMFRALCVKTRAEHDSLVDIITLKLDRLRHVKVFDLDFSAEICVGSRFPAMMKLLCHQKLPKLESFSISFPDWSCSSSFNTLSSLSAFLSTRSKSLKQLRLVGLYTYSHEYREIFSLSLLEMQGLERFSISHSFIDGNVPAPRTQLSRSAGYHISDKDKSWVPVMSSIVCRRVDMVYGEWFSILQERESFGTICMAGVFLNPKVEEIRIRVGFDFRTPINDKGRTIERERLSSKWRAPPSIHMVKADPLRLAVNSVSVRRVVFDNMVLRADVLAQNRLNSLQRRVPLELVLKRCKFIGAGEYSQGVLIYIASLPWVSNCKLIIEDPYVDGHVKQFIRDECEKNETIKDSGMFQLILS